MLFYLDVKRRKKRIISFRKLCFLCITNFAFWMRAWIYKLFTETCFCLQTVPHILYPQDVGFSKDCNKVLNNPDIKQVILFKLVIMLFSYNLHVLQVSLPARMSHDLDVSFENATTAKICEAVRSLTLVIQFLAKVNKQTRYFINDHEFCYFINSCNINSKY